MRLIFTLLSIFIAAPLAAQVAPVQPSTAAATGVVLPPDRGMVITVPSAAPAKKIDPSQPVRYEEAKVPLSGLVMMPTAYRARGKNAIGLGLDLNAAYFIGRLYGKNKLNWTIEKTNYIDRIGLWLLSADSKMQVQTEGKYRPAMAAGVQGIFKFRDAPQPPINGTFNLTVKATGNKTETFANAYMVLTKRLHPKFIVNAGYSDGDMPKVIYGLSEFLSRESINQTNNRSLTAPINIPTGMLFGGIMWMPSLNTPLALEVMVPQGAPMQPKLFNLHLGSLLKLNFEISYLTFKGGWDLLGMFQFRYNFLPK